MATQPVRVIYSITVKDFYSSYRKYKKKELRVADILPYKSYKLLVEDFFLEISKKIIYDNFTFMMPYSLGTLLVKSRETNYKKAMVDYNLTKKHRKVVKHINTHTHGDYFALYWIKSYVQFKNKSYYLFKHISSKKATRNGVGKKGLSHHITALSKDHTKRSYIRK